MSYFKKHSKHGNLFGAILVHEAELRSFVNFLDKNFSEIGINCKTVDSTNITFSDLEEFIEYPNFKARKIIGFELSCNHENQYLDIKFTNERLFIRPNTISYYLRYDDRNWGFRFEEDLKHELKEFHPYYNKLTYFNLTLGFPIALLAFPLLFMAIDYLIKVTGLSGFTSLDYSKSENSQFSSVVLIAWLIPLFLSGYFLNKLRDYLFPILFISTGKQIKEYEKRKKISYFLFGVILIGIVINIASDFIINGS
ncbi:MAG: hypothetical protein BalsKO_16750 [Balneolaceae bacterium]